MGKQQDVFYEVMSSPIGPITVAATERGICHVCFGSGPTVFEELGKWAKKLLDSYRLIGQQTEWTRQAVEQLDQYFDGKRTEFTVPMDLYGTDFQKKVWRQLQNIPYGQVHAYKDVAVAVGSPKAVRAVGGANNRNPLSIFIPCHRVIGANGSLVGYGGGLEIKTYLLDFEKQIVG
ncbi:[Fe-S]-binding protein [Ammoniphilus oxalaticus]|uniref:Methylated-DNA--protein-cysteine methyltransferase n=1 Tax=Ammoniphilus oxalaticus TaxID=66863 RepID=A0A419SD34_9BACL|nr:methylated-DNA--[protein]-cysteine S-methyltransferase [Ammoniphilus oxalaticus]RKD21006.1 [Fe-S]-binding protein [Ammoniphilus oxalaticus]